MDTCVRSIVEKKNKKMKAEKEKEMKKKKTVEIVSKPLLFEGFDNKYPRSALP